MAKKRKSPYQHAKRQKELKKKKKKEEKLQKRLHRDTDTEENSASGVLLRHVPMSVAAVVGCHDAGILAYGEELLIPQLLPTGRQRPAGTNSGS